MGDYDKRMTLARRISERHEMSSKAASQNFHSFLCTHIKIPCMLFLFNVSLLHLYKKPKALLLFSPASQRSHRFAAASNATSGREQHERRPRIDDLP